MNKIWNLYKLLFASYLLVRFECFVPRFESTLTNLFSTQNYVIIHDGTDILIN